MIDVCSFLNTDIAKLIHAYSPSILTCLTSGKGASRPPRSMNHIHHSTKKDLPRSSTSEIALRVFQPWSNKFTGVFQPFFQPWDKVCHDPCLFTAYFRPGGPRAHGLMHQQLHWVPRIWDPEDGRKAPGWWVWFFRGVNYSQFKWVIMGLSGI